MIKKLLSILSLVTVLFYAGSSVSMAASNPTNAIANNKVKFQQMDKNIIETNKQIVSLNAEISGLNNDIKKNNKDIEINTKLIKAEKVHMEKLMKEIGSKQEVANERLRVMYISGYSESFLEILFSAKSFSDFLYKFEEIRTIISFDKKVFDALADKRTILDKTIGNLNTRSEKLEELKNKNIENLSKLDSNKEKLQALNQEFNKEKSAAALAIKENEERLIAHSVSVIDSKSSSIPDVKSALDTLNSLVSKISTSSVKQKSRNYISLGKEKLADLLEKERAAKEKEEKAKQVAANNKTNGTSNVSDNGNNESNNNNRTDETSNASDNNSKESNNNYDETNKTSTVSSGSAQSYKAAYTMAATAYTGGSLTAIGLIPVREPSGLSTIAVDPNVIPLGSKVYVPGYGYAIASDTGSAIVGNIIDLYMNSEEECINWGRRTVTLYIVAYPGRW